MRNPERDPTLAAAGAAGEDEPETAAAAGAPVTDELGELRAQRDEYLAHWQRAQADYQNLRRRLQSDLVSEVARSKAALWAELLLVVDYLEMALSAPAESPDARALQAGVELTRTQLLGVLEREGVRPMPAATLFDPARHEAVERVEETDAEEGRVLATLRRGYLAGEQVLRPAQVRVAVAPAAGGGEGRA